MVNANSNNWKKWGLIGFFITSVSYTVTCLSADINVINDLNIYLKIFYGVGGSCSSALLSSLASTIKYCCLNYYKRKETVENIQDRITINTHIDSANLVTSDYLNHYQAIATNLQSTSISSDTSDGKWKLHAAKNNHLLNDFFKQPKLIPDLKVAYLKIANDFQQQYPELSDEGYLSKLKNHGYEYDLLPKILLATAISEDPSGVVSPKSGEISEEDVNSPDDSYCQPWRPAIA